MGQLRTQKHGKRKKKGTKEIWSPNKAHFKDEHLHNFCNLRCDLFLIYTSDLFVKWTELKQDNNDDGYLGKQEDPS